MLQFFLGRNYEFQLGGIDASSLGIPTLNAAPSVFILGGIDDQLIGGAQQVGDLLVVDAGIDGLLFSGLGQIFGDFDLGGIENAQLGTHTLFGGTTFLLPDSVQTDAQMGASPLIDNNLALVGQLTIGDSLEMGVPSLVVHRDTCQKPLIDLPAAIATMSPADMEAATGVPAEAFQALLDGIPHWQIRENDKIIAQYLGISRQLLRAAVNKAEGNKISERRMSDRSVFSGLRDQ